jgi:hypothetical protein
LLSRIDHLIERFRQNPEIAGDFGRGAQARASAGDGARYFHKVRHGLRNAADSKDNDGGAARDGDRGGDRQNGFRPKNRSLERGNERLVHPRDETGNARAHLQGNQSIAQGSQLKVHDREDKKGTEKQQHQRRKQMLPHANRHE